MLKKISLWPQALSHRNFRRIKEYTTLIRWLDAKPGERILDIGCGDGYFSRMIADQGAHVVGIDINLPMLDAAAKRNRAERTEFQEKLLEIVFTAYLMGRTADERHRMPDLECFHELIEGLDLSGL